MKYANNDPLPFKIAYDYICREVFVVLLLLLITDNNPITIGVNSAALSGVKDCEHSAIVEFFFARSESGFHWPITIYKDNH